VVLCRRLELFSEASVAIDGSEFKAVNTRDRNFTQAKMQRRLAQIDESIARYLSQLDSADRQGEAVPEAKITRLNEKIATLRREIQRLNALNTQMMQTEDKQISLTDPDARSMATSGRGSGMVGYNVQKPDALLHHSDRGSQYTSEQFQRLMIDHGVVCSMSRSGNVWDNAAMESFFSSLKTERTARKIYRTRDEAKADVFDYIERFYNPNRRHSTIGYLSPMEFERKAGLA
jgi:hypothetical protein